MDEQNLRNNINLFSNAGLALVAIPPDQDGKPTKAPRRTGWNKPIGVNNPDGYSFAASDFKNCNGFNFGLYHGASHTLALDLDDVELARKVFEETTDLDLQAWLENDARVEIKSPKANRGKLLFKLPVDFDGAALRQFKYGGNVIFELRCGNCQDVIFGQHPEGGSYQLIGNPASIPEAPAVLLDILSHWDDWKPCFDSALGVEQKPPPIAPPKAQQNQNIPGRRCPISEFNQANSVQSVLLSSGYKQLGMDRFIRPGSESKAPGVVILRNCADGIERAFSHGGDALNDGYAHDAFDCFRLLECTGDFTQALNWDAEITKHNQKLYMAGQSQRTPSSPVSEGEYEEQDPKELPDGSRLTDGDIEILRGINRKYTQAVVGGKNVVISQRHCQVQGLAFAFEPLGEFKNAFVHKPKIARKNQAQAWLEWGSKNYMPNGTGFYPLSDKCPPGVFNFYQGFAVKAAHGDCSIYLSHLKNIICAGDEGNYNYLLGWLAHLVQKPDEKPNVAIVLKSVEGTGKGTLVEPLLQMLGSHGSKINGAGNVAGRFNGVVANKLLIFADEVDLTDSKVADRLKSIITETSVNMERKGLEVEPLPNYCRLIFASNRGRVINAGVRERRYFVLEPSDTKAQDAEYFKALHAWIKKDGAAKLLHYLLSVDISKFSPYKCPQTKALIEEKLNSLTGVNLFFYEEITKDEPFSGKARISASELVDDYYQWSVEQGYKPSKAACRSTLGKLMSKLNIDVIGRSDRGDGKYYEISDPVQVVEVFYKYLGISSDEI